MAPALGRRGHLPVRPHQGARRGVLDRHAAAHRVGHPAPGARVLVHPHRHHRPLPAHARARGLLPDGVGRQRPQRRAPGPDPHRHALRPVAALRPRLPAAREGPQEGQAHPGQPAQLRRAVRRGRRAARAELLRPVVEPRPVGRLDPQLPHHRPRVDQGQPARLPPAGRARPRLPVRGAHAVGRRLPHRGRPGRAAGPRDRPAPTTRSASTGPDGAADLDRHHPPRAAAGLRRPRRPPRRRALPAPVRQDRPHAAVRRRGARRRPRAGRARQGHRHRHDLHVRRHHRRHVVARAAARPARRRRSATAACARSPGASPGGSRPTPPPPRPPTTSWPASTAKQAQARIVELLGRGRADGGRAPPHHPPGEVLGERHPPARDRHVQPVDDPLPRQGRHAGPGPGDGVVARLHAGPLRELGQRPAGRLEHHAPAVLRRPVPRLVPHRRRRHRRLPLADPGQRGQPAGRPHHRRPRPATTTTSATSPAGSRPTPT